MGSPLQCLSTHTCEFLEEVGSQFRVSAPALPSMNVTRSQAQCQLDLPAMIGPVEVYESLGHWNTAVLVILGLHILPVWAVASTLLYRLSSSGRSGLLLSSASLLSVPPPSCPSPPP